MTQHKWHKEIKAWADGAEIESHFKLPRHGNTGWFVSYTPLWNDDNYEHRIKSQPKSDGKDFKSIEYLYVYFNKDIKQLALDVQLRDDLDYLIYIGKIEYDKSK